MRCKPLVRIDLKNPDQNATVLPVALDPLAPFVNGWVSGTWRTACLFIDWEWNPIIAPLPDGSGQYGVIGGVNWLDSLITGDANRCEDASVAGLWRVWVFAGNPVAEFCELMRLYFQRRQLQQAAYRHQLLPDCHDNRLANLSPEEFMDEAAEYYSAVYAFWQQFSQ